MSGVRIGSRASRVVATAAMFALLVTGVPFTGTAAAVTISPTSLTANLNAVTFVNATTGFAVGSGSTILKSTDAGASWLEVNGGGTQNLRGVDFYDASTGFAVSQTGYVLGTSDGGATWQEITADLTGESYQNEDFYDVDFVEPWDGRVAGWTLTDELIAPPVVFRSMNLYGAWGNPYPELSAGTYDPPETRPAFPKDGFGRFYALDFPDSTHGWTVGIDEWNGASIPIVWKYDAALGSNAWVKQTITGSNKLYDVAMASVNAGVIVGEAGVTYYTTNSGVTWTAGASGVASDLLGTDMASTTLGWAAGTGGVIRRTTNGGATWTACVSPTANQLEGLAYVPGTASTAVAVGSGGKIVRTTDGINWSNAQVGGVTPDTTKPTVDFTPAASYNDTATIQINGTDNVGVTSIDYRFSNGTTQTVLGASAQAVAGYGATSLTAVARDAAGNVSPTVTKTVTINDTINPTVNHALTNNTTSYHVVISASDSGSGVDFISYQVDSGATQVVNAASASFDVTGDGNHSFTYSATDVAGNVTSKGPIALNIGDNTAPTVNFTPVASYNDNATINITASDTGGSGVASISYRFSNGTTVTVDGASAQAVTGYGATSLTVIARDVAQNVSAPVTKTFTILDTIKPTAGHTLTNNTTSYHVVINAADSGSGVKSITYSIDGGAEQTVNAASASFDVSGEGAHTVTYFATDVANNVSLTGTANFTVAAPPPVADRTIHPIYTSRYGTAKSIAETGFDPTGDKSWPGVTEVIVASGEDRSAVDALPASGLSFNLKAPLLLINSTGDPAKVEDEIAEIARARGSVKITFVGGTAAIPQATMNALVARVGVLAPGRTVTGVRVAGGNRYDTAVAVSKAIQTRTGRPAPGTVLIANGADQAKFSDALALSPIAAAQGYPILLVSATAVPAETSAEIARLTTAKGSAVGIVAAGGPNTIASSVLTSGLGVTDDAEHRWAGTNRYLTATTIATKAQAKGWLDFGAVGFAASLPDALAGGGMLGSKNGVLLLTQSTVLSPDTAAWLSINGGSIEECYIFGGTVVITPAVEAQINNYLQ